MASNLVIVAIPAEDDYVWKISSEKKPHMTLLFLGDAMSNPNVTKIQGFLEHAVNILEIGPFGLSVDYRGTLGADEADVLFFRDDWSLRRIAEFRGQLLKNDAIRRAYDSTEQFDGPWQPHLTLGYPLAPAHEDDRDYPGIRWVEFDRIALWYGDFEGPEFRLQYPNYDLAEVAWGVSTTAEKGAEFLEHYGVKGMHWGVRKERTAPAATGVKVTSVVKNPKNRKTKIKAEGGHNHPATEDALRVAEARQKLKKSGSHSLTNDELRDVANRLNLEQQVSDLEKRRRTGIGKQFVDQQKGVAKTAALKKTAQVSAKGAAVALAL
jgi:2'-5' RNA ligase